MFDAIAMDDTHGNTQVFLSRWMATKEMGGLINGSELHMLSAMFRKRKPAYLCTASGGGKYLKSSSFMFHVL